MDEEELEARRQLIEQIMEQARAGTLTSDSLAELAHQTTEAGKAQKEMIGAVTKTIGGLGDFTRSVSGSNGEVTTMTGLVTTMGDAIGGLASIIPGAEGAVKGLAAATNFAIGRMQASFESFQDLSDAGVIGAEGITGLRKDFDKAKIPLETYSKMLKNNAEDLSYVFGSALKGSEDFSGAMATMMDGSNDQLRSMGFSVEDMGDTVVDFQKMNQRVGFAQVLTQDQLAKSATEYGSELDMLSKLTGQSRKDVQTQREEMMRDARFRAKIEQMRATGQAKQATELMDYVTLVKTSSPQLAKAVMDLSTGFTNTEEAIKARVSAFGDGIDSSVKGIVNGSQTAVQGFNKIINVAGDAEERQRGITLAVGNTTNAFINYEEVAELARRKNITNEEALTIIQNKQKDKTDLLTKTMVESQNALMQSAVDLDLLSTSHGIAIGVVANFSNMMSAATNSLRELLDIKKPGTGNEDEDDAIARVNEVQSELASVTVKRKIAEGKGQGELVERYDKRVKDLEAELEEAQEDAGFWKTEMGKTEALKKEFAKIKSGLVGQEMKVESHDFSAWWRDLISDEWGDESHEKKAQAQDDVDRSKARMVSIEAELHKRASQESAELEAERRNSTGFVKRNVPGVAGSSQRIGVARSIPPALESGESDPTSKSQAVKAESEKKAAEIKHASILDKTLEVLTGVGETLGLIETQNRQAVALQKEGVDLSKQSLSTSKEQVRNQANQGGV